MKSMSAAALGQ